MTPVEVCCLAVETVWLREGPCGLTARSVTTEAQLLAGDLGVVVGSTHKQLYHLQDESGEVAFGSVQGLIGRAHLDAYCGLERLVANAESAGRVDGLIEYWAGIEQRPAWLRMITTGEGPEGIDARFNELCERLAAVCGRRGHLTLAALHGIIQGDVTDLSFRLEEHHRRPIVAWLTGEVVDTLELPDAA